MDRASFMRGGLGLMTHWLYNPVGMASKADHRELSEQEAEWNAHERV